MMIANERAGSEDGKTIRDCADFFGGPSAGESSPERAVDDDECEAINRPRQVRSDEVVVHAKGPAGELGEGTLAKEVIVMDVRPPFRTPTPNGESAVQPQVSKWRSD